MKKGFTLIELLVVIAVIAVLMAIGLPSLRRVREIGWETECQNNLRQLSLSMKNYLSDHDGLFPTPYFLYHSRESMDMRMEAWGEYPVCCRWHDERMALDGPLLRVEHPELRGIFWNYIDRTEMLVCKVGQRANELRGCYNTCIACDHRDDIGVSTQYTYCMNWYLGSELLVGRSLDESNTTGIEADTKRKLSIRRETQITRSASNVYLFGEENSWAINTQGRQLNGRHPELAAEYDLSGRYKYEGSERYMAKGGLRLPSLEVRSSYYIKDTRLCEIKPFPSDAFATCHRPWRGDLNTGHSYVVMLDGHTRKVTVSDQLRLSKLVPTVEPSELGPGGNVALAWPSDIPPSGGWDNQ